MRLRRTYTISIHAPRTGSDRSFGTADVTDTEFQSTLPARGATSSAAGTGKGNTFQSTLPARGATKGMQEKLADLVIFQSTLPARGATTRSIEADGKREISIHAPRTGSDMLPILYAKHPKDFNPRSPHGERLRGYFLRPRRLIFQSTLPARGATRAEPSKSAKVLISIHAPRTGSDARACGGRPRKRRFQSTLPARGATRPPIALCRPCVISIHAPRTGSDDY